MKGTGLGKTAEVGKTPLRWIWKVNKSGEPCTGSHNQFRQSSKGWTVSRSFLELVVIKVSYCSSSASPCCWFCLWPLLFPFRFFCSTPWIWLIGTAAAPSPSLSLVRGSGLRSPGRNDVQLLQVLQNCCDPPLMSSGSEGLGSRGSCQGPPREQALRRVFGEAQEQPHLHVPRIHCSLFQAHEQERQRVLRRWEVALLHMIHGQGELPNHKSNVAGLPKPSKPLQVEAWSHASLLQGARVCFGSLSRLHPPGHLL